nr:immunoglobulin light chain junction region [Macaca mulatta]MOX69478.1 immunoglobulin light chain junction region [Macaca mulatta]MOX69621.1 immunoglobulin light chain junction region [Macaca mulatta]MOX70470.1 immunoglobulin light chain junction region [Macaca mulatta]MOX72224.1 immunoglobulin light chain junction region [Macaca mulatta]
DYYCLIWHNNIWVF